MSQIAPEVFKTVSLSSNTSHGTFLIFRDNFPQKKKFQKWDSEECSLYQQFIQENQYIIRPGIKRNNTLFILMSRFIKTKNPFQCQIHHQKFYRKIFNIPKKPKKEKPMKKKDKFVV
jgi:hypothetical protein